MMTTKTSANLFFTLHYGAFDAQKRLLRFGDGGPILYYALLSLRIYQILYSVIQHNLSGWSGFRKYLIDPGDSFVGRCVVFHTVQLELGLYDCIEESKNI
jgi:hypothetical protein